MERIINLCEYLPAQETHISPNRPKRSGEILLAFEAVVTFVIGVSMMVGIGAFLLML